MPVINVKYAKTDTRTGNLIYRRRVPKMLQSFFPGQTMLVKALGKGTGAMIAYGKYHEHIEHILSLAQNGVTGLIAAEQRERLKAMSEGWGADPYSAGVDENEQAWRGEAVSELADRFQHPETVEYVGVPENVAAIASALLGGVPDTIPEPTIKDAFKFYLKENAQAIAENGKRQVQRFRRAERNVDAAVGSDKPASKVTRTNAFAALQTTTIADPAAISASDDARTSGSFQVSELSEAERNGFNSNTTRNTDENNDRGDSSTIIGQSSSQSTEDVDTRRYDR